MVGSGVAKQRAELQKEGRRRSSHTQASRLNFLELRQAKFAPQDALLWPLRASITHKALATRTGPSTSLYGRQDLQWGCAVGLALPPETPPAPDVGGPRCLRSRLSGSSIAKPSLLLIGACAPQRPERGNATLDRLYLWWDA